MLSYVYTASHQFFQRILRNEAVEVVLTIIAINLSRNGHWDVDDDDDDDDAFVPVLTVRCSSTGTVLGLSVLVDHYRFHPSSYLTASLCDVVVSARGH